MPISNEGKKLIQTKIADLKKEKQVLKRKESAFAQKYNSANQQKKDNAADLAAVDTAILELQGDIK